MPTNPLRVEPLAFLSAAPRVCSGIQHLRQARRSNPHPGRKWLRFPTDFESSRRKRLAATRTTADPALSTSDAVAVLDEIAPSVVFRRA